MLIAPEEIQEEASEPHHTSGKVTDHGRLSATPHAAMARSRGRPSMGNAECATECLHACLGNQLASFKKSLVRKSR